MHKSNFILFTLVNIFLIGCTNQIKPASETENITPINPIVERKKAEYFQNRQAHNTFNTEDAQSYTIQTHPDELVHARQQAYQTILAKRLRDFSIKEFYFNGNGIVFITSLPSIDNNRFRDFIRSGFCPIVDDLSQTFANNRRVIMLDQYKRQGRYLDYSYELCKIINKMTVRDANQEIFSKIMAY